MILEMILEKWSEPCHIESGGPSKGFEFCSSDGGKPLEGFKRER